MPKDDTFAGLMFELKGKLGQSSFDPSAEIINLSDVDFPGISIAFPEDNIVSNNGRGPNFYCQNLTFTNLDEALVSSTYQDMIIAGYWVCRDF